MVSHVSQALLFRPFVAEDADLLGGWLAAVGLGLPPGVVNRNWADRIIRDPRISCWVATQSDVISGFFRLDTGPDRQAEITLIVGPGRRRTGLGRRLLDEALRQARSQGIGKFQAVVAEDNATAIGFFESAGFTTNGSNTPGNIHLHRLIHRADRQPPLEI